VCEGGAGGETAEAGSAELARQQIRAEEGERVREDDEQVVDDERRVRALRRDHAGGRVPEERVAEGEAVLVRPVRVRLEEIERVVEQGVADPGDLPGLERRVVRLLRRVRAQVQDERPRHRDRDGKGKHHREHAERGPPAPARAELGDEVAQATVALVRQPSAYDVRATSEYGHGLTIARISACTGGRSTTGFRAAPFSSPQTS